MVNESDADRIQREKDRRRAEERLRIEREHHRRLHDLEVLRRSSPHPASEGATHSPTEPISEPSPTPRKVIQSPSKTSSAPGSSEPEAESASTPPKTTQALTPRLIGRPVRSDTLRNFLALDPAEQFDIQALNQLSLGPLLREGGDDPDLLALLAERSEALMERVKREVDDPLSAGALLREFALTWYRESPSDPNWSHRAAERWGGIFAESKITGGKLHPWLNWRLWTVLQRSVRDGPVRQRVRRGLSRAHVAETAVNRTAIQQIQAEVAQALTDDLASGPRKPDTAFPLVHLSELAVRRQVATINEALGLLFSSSESGPFVVLHPNRYPDCEELQIRPPSGAASGAALAFTLVTPHSPRRAGGRTGGAERPETPAADAGSSENLSEEDGLDAATIWEAKAASPGAWRSVLEECRREKRRLDAPPRDYRTRAAYGGLRDQLLLDGEFRKAFLGVKWRGRPAGLPILAALLQKGTMAPEVATDHEYLEAELGELSQGDPQFVPEGGTWKFPGWTVTREGTHRDGFRYRAVPDAADAK
jgi:hypothetical protein